MSTHTTVNLLEAGRAYSEAYAAPDYQRLEALLHPDARLRALVRGELLEFEGPRGIIDDDLKDFFARYDRHEVLEHAVASSGDHVQIHNRWRLHKGPDTWLLDFRELCYIEDGRVKTIDAICSGPVPERDARV